MRLSCVITAALTALLFAPGAQAAPVVPDAATFARGYMDFLGANRTELEATDTIEEAAIAAGYRDLATYGPGDTLQPGDRVYLRNHDKAIILAQIGVHPVSEGVHLVAGHIDSPHLTLKAHPLYDSQGFYLLQTHTYGGIKRYQWVNQPLEVHGVWYDAAGAKHHVIIGDDVDEPTLVIPDLEPHLSKDQNNRSGPEMIGAEETDPLVGMKTDTSKPWNAGPDWKAPEVPSMEAEVLAMLKPYLGTTTLTPTDLATGEFHIVPANTPRLCGLDGSMVAAYGQDDRANSYLGFRAMMTLPASTPYTAMGYFVGQEEIGSVNNTGAGSSFLNLTIASLLEHDPRTGATFGDNVLRACLRTSWVLSADTPAAVNPIFSDVWESGNTIHFGDGPAVMKWGAGRDANPEFFAKVAAIFDDAGIPWQADPLGKNGAGGGGTIGGFMSQEGMEVIDIGVSLLSMHSPYELSNVNDLWWGYQAYGEFLKNDRRF